MRVLIVGPPLERAHLRAQLTAASTTESSSPGRALIGRSASAIEIAGEFSTLAGARAANVDVDAIVIVPGRNAGASAERDRDDWQAEPLTPREIQVLELLAEGLPNKAIADRLEISDQTVKFHVASISGKLGAANRTDAVRLAVRRGLITL
jgi:NarL family two-component system response regulator YdfI